jgi:hypothetical protein
MSLTAFGRRLAKCERNTQGLIDDTWTTLLRLASDEELHELSSLLNGVTVQNVSELPPEGANRYRKIVGRLLARRGGR